MNITKAELQKNISTGLTEVEDILSDSLKGSRGLIDTIAKHLSNAGGKRMRPALVLLCAHLGKDGITEAVKKAAVVVELTHLATLYHDDVMDSAPTRRGSPAVHKVWGNNAAILAGDLVFARASQICADLGDNLVRQHALTFDRLCQGQLNETFGPDEVDDPVDFYIQVLADKTGSLVAQAARFGAELGGADSRVGEIVYQFGDQVGVAFQLADDVIDLASDEEVSGKTPGTDLKEGVETMPTLLLRQAYARGELETDSTGMEIIDLLENGDMTNPDILKKTVLLLRQHPVLEETRQLAFKWCDKARQSIAELPDSTVKDALNEFADTLVARIS